MSKSSAENNMGAVDRLPRGDDVDNIKTIAAYAEEMIGARADVSRKLSQAQDSDSGHEQTPSSSTASNCDSDESAQFNNHSNRNELGSEAETLLQIGHKEDSDNSDEDQADDCFEDASEELCPGAARAAAHAGLKWARAPSERANLTVRLEETREILRLALSNEFNKALELCEERATSELYASLAHATLSFLRAALTCERIDIQAALAAITQAFEVSQSQRRQVSAASMFARLLYKPNYDSYTDDEIHAELVSAESMLLLSLISFLADQSVLCLVRGAFRIRACHQRYKECLYILEHRRRWSSEAARRHFESGVRMGHGVFNLLMSYLPRRVLKFLEYVGFSGSRTTGVAELDRSIELADGLRSVFSALVILTYHSYVENLFGLGHYDELKVEQLNETFLAHYPNSAFFLLFLGRYHQMRGHLEAAIRSFERCCQVQQDWRQFHSICHWEIMWCYASQMDWPKAAHYADLLRANSKWSPASYQYQYGTFLYAQLKQEQRRGLIEARSSEFQRRLVEVRHIIERVPELRIRYAGKTIPADKFAITRAAKFARQSNRLALPALEFLYIWNIFCTLKNSPRQVEALLAHIELEIEGCELGSRSGTISSEREESNTDSEHGSERHPVRELAEGAPTIDDLCLMQLLKGMCLKHLGRFDEAERAFLQVLEHESQIREDKFLVPHSAMELAILSLHLKQFQTAKSWIRRARHNYTGYLMETIVHFRLHAASRLIRIEEGRQSLAANSSALDNKQHSDHRLKSTLEESYDIDDDDDDDDDVDDKEKEEEEVGEADVGADSLAPSVVCSR